MTNYSDEQQDNQPETLSDIAMDRVKDAAGNYVKNAPKRMGRRLLWGIILSFTMPGEGRRFTRDRLLRRAERGEKITLHEALFGATFSLTGCVRTITFLLIIGVVLTYLWYEGLLQQMIDFAAIQAELQNIDLSGQ